MPTSSSNQNLHTYDNFICIGCSVVFQFPEISDDVLVDYYNNEYRISAHALNLKNKKIDLPISIPWSGFSFQRFQTFFNIIEEIKNEHANITPTQAYTIIDIGAYQGFFLFAAKQAWGCKTIGYDYSKKGMKFAEQALGITESHVAHNIYQDTFKDKAKFVTLIHTFEHLREPNKFLEHLTTEILYKNGYLYLEVPNLNGSPLSDPTHFFTYSPHSLKFILEKNDFKVLKMIEHGKPLTKNGIWENSKMNLSVLAKHSQIPILVNPPKFKAKIILKDLYRQHRKIIRTSILKQFVVTVKSIIQLLYLFVFILILEKFSYRMAKKLKNILLNRKSTEK